MSKMFRGDIKTLTYCRDLKNLVLKLRSWNFSERLEFRD